MGTGMGEGRRMERVVLVIEEAPDGSFGGYVGGRPVFSWGKRSPEEVVLSLLEGLRIYEELTKEETEA